MVDLSVTAGMGGQGGKEGRKGKAPGKKSRGGEEKAVEQHADHSFLPADLVRSRATGQGGRGGKKKKEKPRGEKGRGEGETIREAVSALLSHLITGREFGDRKRGEEEKEKSLKRKRERGRGGGRSGRQHFYRRHLPEKKHASERKKKGEKRIF